MPPWNNYHNKYEEFIMTPSGITMKFCQIPRIDDLIYRMEEVEKIPRIDDLIYRMEEVEKMSHNGKILIMIDKNDPSKVIAKDLVTGKKAEAKCHKNDNFEFNIGAKLAFDRLMFMEQPFRVPEKKYWTGKVICVEYLDSNDHNFLTVGKVYNVKNGFLIDNEKNETRPWMQDIKNVDDLNRRANRTAKFIEFKGGAEE